MELQTRGLSPSGAVEEALILHNPLIEFTFKKFLCVWVVFPFLFSLFQCCRHVTRLGYRGPLPAPTRTHFPARARCHPGATATAVESRDVPVRHLINSLIAAGQKEDPFRRIGEPGRQRYTACLRGLLAQDKVCPSAWSQKGRSCSMFGKTVTARKSAPTANRTFFIRS